MLKVNFSSGSKQKIQPLDLFYEIEPAEVLFVINKVSDLETFQITEMIMVRQKFFKFLYSKKIIYRTKVTIPILTKEVMKYSNFISRPLDPSLLKIPIKGEIVPIINFVSSKSNN